MPPPYRSVTETAKRFRLSTAWVRRLAQRGEIPGALKIGRTYAIPATWRPDSPQSPKRGSRGT